MLEISKIEAFYATLICLIAIATSSRLLFEKSKSDGKCKGQLLKAMKASRFSCMSNCNEEDQCVVVNHMEEMGMCELLSSENSAPAETETVSGWACYNKPNRDFCSTATDLQDLYPCCVLGTSRCVPARSCLHLTTTCPSYSFESGLYWIQGPLNAFQVFCDMETHGGGWTKVANVNTTSGIYPNPATYLNDDITMLYRASNDFFTLSTSGLAELRRFIEFTQLRVFCFKPGVNRTIHITTTKSDRGVAVVDFMTGRTNTRPAACNSYTVLPDDTSVISKRCSQWADGSWSFDSNARSDRLYIITAYIPNIGHIGPGNFDGRYECDDHEYRSKGTWAYFLR